jgi:hypothetical protein
MPLRPLLLLVLMISTLSACQQAAWKAGATSEDLKRDEQTCRSQVLDDDAAIKQCLRAKGWTVTDFSSSSDSDSAASSESTPNVTTSSIAAQPSSSPLNTTVRPENNAPTNIAADKKNIKSAEPEVNPLKKITPSDPLQRVQVQTRWKAGAQAADFNADASVCLEQLGMQHKPDYAKHLFTRATVSCLRARGWYAGSDPVYTPLR